MDKLTDEQYDVALDWIDSLMLITQSMDKGETPNCPALQARFDVLSALMSFYEDHVYPIEPPEPVPDVRYCPQCNGAMKRIPVVNPETKERYGFVWYCDPCEMQYFGYGEPDEYTPITQSGEGEDK